MPTKTQKLIIGDWTQEEIERYKSIANEKLGLLYVLAGIDLDHPEQRAEYLAEKILKLTSTDQDMIMRRAHDLGKHIALRDLEEMVYKTYFSRKPLNNHY
jgi:hypothetical protein